MNDLHTCEFRNFLLTVLTCSRAGVLAALYLQALGEGETVITLSTGASSNISPKYITVEVITGDICSTLKCGLWL